ncbi:MAG: hypothetical protein Q8M91_07495 [Polaromonas sp.]|nr:hypothetical protein [Polaromonas sp.]
MRSRICLVLSALALAGCVGLDSGRRPEVVIDRAGVDVVAADAARQLTYMKERGATERFCRGPSPDSVTTASAATQLGAPSHGTGLAEVGTSATRGGLDLGGRNPAVLIARELLYRACELASNINADAGTEQRIYGQFLNAIVEIAKVQTGAGTSALGADPAAISLPAAMPASTPAATGDATTPASTTTPATPTTSN